MIINPNITIYQDPVNVPDEYLQIVTQLKRQAQDVRFEYIQKRNANRRRTTGNVAVAQLVILGQDIVHKAATSKKDPMNRPLNDNRSDDYTGPKQHFHPYPNPAQRNAPLNIEHAEYKVLNALADVINSLEIVEEATAEVLLYTEKKMCPACRLVALDFEASINEKFKDVKIVIVWTYPYG